MKASFIFLPFRRVRFISLSLSCTEHSTGDYNLECFLLNSQVLDFISCPLHAIQPSQWNCRVFRVQQTFEVKVKFWAHLIPRLHVFTLLWGFISSFNNYILSAYKVPGTAQETSVTSVNKIKIPALKGLSFGRKRQKMNHKHNK